MYPGLYPAMTPGLNHDNDIVLLWINGSLDCQTEDSWQPNPNYTTYPAQANCILYDTAMAPGDPDDPLMDVVQLPVGWLNGDYAMPSNVQSVLTNHGITSANYQDIMNADPYYSCRDSISCVQTIGANSTRFTLATTGTPIDFENLGNTTKYTVQYATTSSQGQGATDTHSVAFSKSGNSNFFGVLSLTLKNQTTLTWTNKWSKTTTNMVGQSAAVNIAEPPPSINYNGPVQFAVYQDNVYGTFMCYPTQ